MRYSDLTEAETKALSMQQALDAGMFGPVYHGTSADMDEILSKGFNVKFSVPHMTYRERAVGPANGYTLTDYSAGIAAPIHHLGFGVYFTTVKATAKKFASGTTRGRREFFLDVPRLATINFGAPGTMMRWWQEHGYDMTVAETRARDHKAWVRATGNLTRTLRQEYDGVWYKGKGIRRLLDGDQIVVFSSSRIHVVDPKLSSGLEVGSKVVATGSSDWSAIRGRNDYYVAEITDNERLAGWSGVYRAIDWDGNEVSREKAIAIHYIPPKGLKGVIVKRRVVPEQRRNAGEFDYDVKWSKGGVMFGYEPKELEPLQ